LSFHGVTGNADRTLNERMLFTNLRAIEQKCCESEAGKTACAWSRTYRRDQK